MIVQSMTVQVMTVELMYDRTEYNSTGEIEKIPPEARQNITCTYKQIVIDSYGSRSTSLKFLVTGRVPRN